MRSGSPAAHTTSSSNSSGGGRSAGSPSGVPSRRHASSVSISHSWRDMSSLKCWMPMSFSTYHGGIAPARSRIWVRRAIMLA